MPDRFLCDDASCWIDPEMVAARRPELRVDPVLLYTPLGFGDNWLDEALRPISKQPLGEIYVRSPGASLELPAGRLTTMTGMVGAPSTVSAPETAIARGARRILFFGICGALQPDLRIGDMLAVDE